MAVEIDPALSGQKILSYPGNRKYQTPGIPSALNLNTTTEQTGYPNSSSSNYTISKPGSNFPPGYSQFSPTSVSSGSSMSNYTVDSSKDVRTSFATNQETQHPLPPTEAPFDPVFSQALPQQSMNDFQGLPVTSNDLQSNYPKNQEYLNTSSSATVAPSGLGSSYLDEARPVSRSYEPVSEAVGKQMLSQNPQYYNRTVPLDYEGSFSGHLQGQPKTVASPSNYQLLQQSSGQYLPSSHNYLSSSELLPPNPPSVGTGASSRIYSNVIPSVPYSNYFIPNPPIPSQPYVNTNYLQYTPQQSQQIFSSETGASTSSNNSTFAASSQTRSDYIPLNVGSWEANPITQTQQPYKPLVLLPGESLEHSVMTRLTCKPNSNEYSPIFKADTRFNSSMSSKPGRGKTTRIENLLRTGGTTRTYLLPGLYSGQGDLVQTGNNPPQVAGQEILRQCIMAIFSAVGTSTELSSYLSPITDLGLTETSREPSRGVKDQLQLPEGISLIMDARHKTEIEQTFMKWTSHRPKTENFFRLEDKKGLNFSLEELKEALDIIMSRPPRRINHYPSRQLLTDVTYSQGRGVTEFNSNQLTHLHSLSQETRQPGGFAPAGSMPSTLPDGRTENIQTVHYKISHEDAPFINSKKSSRYDPHYCRRHGIYKEGWCGYCKMGGWYLMKNSGYLYHQNHEHGIFPGGCVFEDPLVIRRKVIREARWEGLCGICYHWIDLDHTDRKLWGTWYRHYKLCVNEYEEIKKVLRATFAPIELVEIKYQPGNMEKQWV